MAGATGDISIRFSAVPLGPAVIKSEIPVTLEEELRTEMANIRTPIAQLAWELRELRAQVKEMHGLLEQAGLTPDGGTQTT